MIAVGFRPGHDWRARTVEVMAPYAERLKDGEKFLVVDVVIELRRIEGVGVESNRVNFTIL